MSLSCLAMLLLLSACTSQPQGATAIPAPATPRVGYQVVGSTKSSFMLVIESSSITDRDGLEQLGEYLCREQIKCQVWFWDDLTKADTSFPLDPEKQATAIAKYTWDMYSSQGELVIFEAGN